MTAEQEEAGLQSYDQTKGTRVRVLASTEQWKDAYRQSLQPLQELTALGLQNSGDLARALNLRDSNLVFKALLENKDNAQYLSLIHI